MQTSTSLTPFVQRYRRTDTSRAGDWQPVDSIWKSAASAGLVSHDMYHHLPGDSGTFAEEVATFGAEWYMETQPIGKSFDSIRTRALELFEGQVVDTVLNALDSREELLFCLPVRAVNRLADVEMDYFEVLATKALEVLEQSTDLRALNRPAFTDRFVQNLLWGYAQAHVRFPDQHAVRAGILELRDTLAYLEKHEVPIGHEVTLALDGYTCSLTYEDADAAFLQENKVVEAKLMVWCSGAPGYPHKEISLHADETDYADFISEYLIQQEELSLPEELRLFPRTESSGLHKVYVRDPEMQRALRDGHSVKLPFTALAAAESTPRQIPVF